MSEAVYAEIEDAIARQLHLGAPPKALSMHGMHWHYPVAIELGDVVMRDSDCGLARPTWKITIDEWRERVERYGLWKSVGLWEFVPAEDPTASCIAYCHRNPNAAGMELYWLRKRIEELEGKSDG